MFKKEHKDNVAIMQHTADLLETAHHNVQVALKRLEGTIDSLALKAVGEEIQRWIKKIDNHVMEQANDTKVQG